MALQSHLEKTLEAKVAKFEQKLKTPTSLAQIFESKSFSRAKANMSTFDLYMFRAKGLLGILYLSLVVMVLTTHEPVIVV